MNSADDKKFHDAVNVTPLWYNSGEFLLNFILHGAHSSKAQFPAPHASTSKIVPNQAILLALFKQLQSIAHLVCLFPTVCTNSEAVITLLTLVHVPFSSKELYYSTS